jgi:NTP pyrophosphatase (non-canonical NTP hydrolase)
MAELKASPTLQDLQQYVKEIALQRGWNKNNAYELFLLFAEEVGELAKAIRKHQGLYTELAKENTQPQLEEEFADVLNYLLDLANLFQVDLEKAFRNKETVNAQRKWH